MSFVDHEKHRTASVNANMCKSTRRGAAQLAEAIASLESPLGLAFHSSGYVVMMSDKDIRRGLAIETESRNMSPIVPLARVLDQGRSQSFWLTEMKESATYSGAVWEWKTQMNSWIEEYPQHSHPTQTYSQQHHRPYSEQQP